MAPRVVLVGPMGAGKSAVGALVAASLGAVLRDTDADVEATAGCTVAEVFAREGEAGFRVREREAVARALAEHDGVLALGGGAVLDAATRADLRHHLVVQLAVTWEHVRSRVGAAADRPLLSGGAEERWTALLAARRALYDEVADHVVPTDGLSAEDVAARVVLAVLGQNGTGADAGGSDDRGEDADGADGADVRRGRGTAGAR